LIEEEKQKSLNLRFELTLLVNMRAGGSGAGRLGGGGSCNGDYGLLKLRDDVQMCTYQDVQVMWNMLSGSQANDVSSAKPVAQPLQLESSKQRRISWRLVFWSNRR
jgi:hypothetical protein